MSKSSNIISKTDLEKASGKDGEKSWIQVGNGIYDVSTFKLMHPGGAEILKGVAGKNATKQFYAFHRHDVLEKWENKLRVGTIEDADEDDAIKDYSEISQVPYAEPMHLRGYESPYMHEGHIEFRKKLRKWCYTNIHLTNIAEEHEESGERIPDTFFKLMGDVGLLAARLGPGLALSSWRDQVKKDSNATIFGVKIDDFDYFHEAIAHEELGRCGCGGFYSGCGDGMVIGLPPVVQFGPDWMKKKIVPEVLSGEKRICLAITEPQGGSDVANLHTTAVKSDCGKYYIVNGHKKWITQGHHAHYFVTAVRTGGKGASGVSMLLLERGMEGLRTKSIKTSYSSSAGTALVIMENVKVPVENLLGEENGGFMCVMYNFNHERWYIITYIIGACRGIINQCMTWTHQRVAFKKRLIDQPVIRLKLAQMIGAVEAVAFWLEHITYQMNNMDYEMQSLRLAGHTSLLKYQSTRVANMVADLAVQIFGGRGITKDGMGKLVERFNVGNKFAAILGGSEEIMADLAIKMAMRQMPKTARL